MDVVHPKMSIKKLHHTDKNENQTLASQNIFHNFGEGERNLTPTSSHQNNKANKDIPHRFNVNDVKIDVERLLHGSDI